MNVGMGLPVALLSIAIADGFLSGYSCGRELRVLCMLIHYFEIIVAARSYY